MAPSGYKLYDRFRRCNEENLYRPIIAGAIDKAEITSDANLAFVVITNSSRMIYQYILRSMGAESMGEIYRKDHKLDPVIELFINFLKVGLTDLPNDKEP